jgi:hypothetical protein
MIDKTVYSNDYRMYTVYRDTDRDYVYWYEVTSIEPSTRFKSYNKVELKLIKRCDHHETYCNEQCAPDGYDSSLHPLSTRPIKERRAFNYRSYKELL